MLRQEKLMIWASLGLVVLLCAPWLLPSNKLYHQAIIALLWLPALLELALVRRPRPVFTSPEALLYGLFATWTLVVLGIEGGDDAGRFKVPFYVGLTLLGMLLAAQVGRQCFLTLLCACCLFGGLLAGLSWFYFYLYQDHAWGQRLVALGLWDTPIMAAHAVGALAVLGVFLAPSQKGRPWMLRGGLLAGIGYALFLGSSQTPGVWIALMAALLIMAGVTRQRHLLVTLVLVCGGALAIFLLEPQMLLQRDVQYWPLLWSGGLQLMGEHWLTGVGFHEFYIYLVEFDHSFKHPHNMFLNVGVRLGVFGLLCWTALWAAIGWRAWQQRHDELGRSLLALWFFSSVVLLSDGFGPWLKPSADWLVTWVPLGLSLVLAEQVSASKRLDGCGSSLVRSIRTFGKAVLADSDKSLAVMQHWLVLGLFVQLAGLCLVTDGSRYTTLVNLLLFLPALLATLTLWRKINPWPPLASLALGTLLLWVLLVAVLNPGSVGELKRWLRVTLYAWLYLLAITLVMQNERLWRRLLGTVVLVAAICAWGSLIQHYYVDQRSIGYREFRIFAWGWRGLADFNNTIVAALYYSVVLLIALSWLLQSKSVAARSLYSLAALGLLAYLYFTFSRGVWGAALAGVIALFWFALNGRARLVLLGVAAPLFIAMIWLVGGSSEEGMGRGLSYRDLIWQGWWDRISDFWLWGAGAGAEFNICIEKLRSCFNQAHSLYLQFCYEYGLPGLLLLLALLLALLIHAWRCRQQPMGQLGLALLVFALIAGVGNFSEIFLRPGVFWIVFWLPVGILLGLAPDSRRAASVE